MQAIKSDYHAIMWRSRQAFSTFRSRTKHAGGLWRAAGAAAAAAVAASTAACAAASSAGSLASEGAAAPSGACTVNIPTDKLACRAAAAPPRTPTVLVACGSFNPPTYWHLRMFELAQQELCKRGYDVWGGYLSPVGDAYGKQGLAPAHHRLAMCQLAAGLSDGLMVDAWEAEQPRYTRTLQVLDHVYNEMQKYMASFRPTGISLGSTAPVTAQEARRDADGSAMQVPGRLRVTDNQQQRQQQRRQQQQVPPPSSGSGTTPGTAEPPCVRVMLLCGADLLASMNVPGLWKDPDVLLERYGVVVVARSGTDVEAALSLPGSVLAAHRERVIVVEEPIANGMSSSLVREQLRQGGSVRYLLPDSVLAYIRGLQLYSAR